MYRIKSKPGYNAFIKDINISLRCDNNNWLFVDEEKYDASNDAKNLADYIIVERADGNEKVIKTPIEREVIKVQDGVFVKGGNIQTNPTDVFVATPEISEQNPENISVEQTIEPLKEEVTETVVETAEPVVESVEKVEETVSEVEENSVEETVEEKAKSTRGRKKKQ